MKITLAQISPKLNRTNLIDIVSIINEHKDESDLIVFPELALNGYLLQDKLFEDAYNIDELDCLKELSLEIDIIVGGAIRDNKVFRNASLCFSKGELISQHNKVHLPNYGMFEEARYFSPGNVFEGFDMPYGKISMLVCEDLWHAGVHQQLFNEDPDYVVVIVASPARGFDDDGLSIKDQWLALLKSASLHCNAKVIFVNRVGFEDGLGFWGGSCIVDKNAKVIHSLAMYEKTIKTFEI
ncbi:MAG: nitrilase [Sulfurimonas sp.]|nr:nitrilase [Sulfurimonas sp.]